MSWAVEALDALERMSEDNNRAAEDLERVACVAQEMADNLRRDERRPMVGGILNRLFWIAMVVILLLIGASDSFSAQLPRQRPLVESSSSPCFLPCLAEGADK